MGIRETLNNNPKFVVRGTIVVIVLAVSYVVWYALPTGTHANYPLEYYTDDDGATWFTDSALKLPPFDHNSHEAVIAKVYRCQNGTTFVGYLEKFSDAAKKRITEGRDNNRIMSGTASSQLDVDTADLLVKKPHDGNWISARDPKATEVETVRGPDGSVNCEPMLP